MAAEELKYFFSYKREDKDSEFALRLAKELRAAGANVWLDQLDILGGRRWIEAVQEALESCKGMVAVLSPESIASKNVMDEVLYALDEDKLVVPVLLRPCKIPFRLKQLQYVDFTADYDAGFTQLLRSLGIEQPAQPPESAAAQEPVVQDPTATPEAKSTEPPVQEEQAVQEAEEPSPAEVSESTPGAPDHPEPAGPEIKKAPSISQKNKVLAAICVVALITIVLTAIFPNGGQPKTYSLTITMVDGSVTKDPNKASYKRGETVLLTAVPDPNYRFDAWLGALSGSTNPAKLVMDADKSITANFTAAAPTTYTLSTSGANGSVTKKPDKASYIAGETVTVQAIPDTGYEFASWSEDLSGSTNPATVTMDADKSVTANFALKTYSLTAIAVHGNITRSPDQAKYNHGELVAIHAVPDKGYNFTNWSGDLSDSNNPGKLVMDADKLVTASFAVRTYSLTADAANGSVTKSPDKVVYNHGETVTLRAVPNPGHIFRNWSGSLSGSTNPATLVMDAEKSVTASFALPKAGDVVANSIGMKLVYIPAGNFGMGNRDSAEELAKDYRTPKEDFEDEFPQHEVHISKAFWMGQTEVTQGQYESVMNARPWSGKLYVQEDANNPAVYVSWDDAAEFCTKLSQQTGEMYRLPTEAEWEYACRAGTKTRFSFGDDASSLGDYAWFRDNALNKSEIYAHRVGWKKPNPWGLYDMHGNVWEYCNDWYGTDYYKESPPNDPTGPATRKWCRVMRGGCLYDLPLNCRSADRPGYTASDRAHSVGFRVVRSQPDVVANSIGMRLVYVPPGSFMMGSGDSAAQLAKEYGGSEGEFAHEFPQHEVHISKGFWMGQTEVTQGQYESVMNAKPWSDDNRVQENPNNPAVCVSWNEVQEFCRKLSQQTGETYRLPTEAEWEYACRAGTKTRFSFGDIDSSLGDYAWFHGNAYDVDQKYAHRVGQKSPNPWGLYDMHGNVWEWCSDRYDAQYYAESPKVDPPGPSYALTPIWRGGYYFDTGNSLRCSFRSHPDFYNGGFRWHYVGFRVVRSQS